MGEDCTRFQDSLRALIPTAALAEEPILAIRLTNGESALYPVSEIERIYFEEYFGVDELVVELAEGIDPYPLESIEQMEFLFDFSSVSNPEDAAAAIQAIRLFQNQPNPFSFDTQIAFELPQDGGAQVQIYSPDGRHVRTLVAGDLEAGRHTIGWDGRDDAGHEVPAGVYFYSLHAPEVEESRRMILLPR